MVQKLSDHLNISLGLAAQTDSADVLAIIRETNIAMDSGTMGDFVGTIAGKGSDAGITVLNSGTNNADVQLRLDSAVAATLTGTQTLTNKSINLTNNSLTGTIGQWNAALSGGNSFTTLTGTETLTNKTLTSPVLNTVDINSGAINDISTFSLRDATVTTHELLLAANSSVNASADRTLTFDVKNANRTLSLLGNLTLGGSLTTSGAYGTTLTSTGTTSVTLPTSGTLISKDGSNNVTGINNITATGTVDGRDLSVDGAKLDLIEAQADVTDAGNVGTALTAFSTGTDAVSSDLIPVYDASSNTWEKQTIENAALVGTKGQKGAAGTIGVDGAKGQKGQKGQKGEVGQKGQKGEVGVTGAGGSKGQKGEIGATGTAGGTGSQGSKGEKGQKGEVGVTGSTGAKGQKGQKGEAGTNGTNGAKGQKGEVGEKGQKGDKGDKGQKGQGGTNGDKGQKGQKGHEGAFGGASFGYTFSTTTTQSDPGAGTARLNDATESSATKMFLDDTANSNGTNTDIQPFLRTIDDSTSTIKGHVRICNKENTDDFAIYTISSVSEQTGYFIVNISYVSGPGNFTNSEEVVISFARTGDVGDTGSKGQKGEVGQKGQKGEVGQKGEKGQKGDKGQKGEVGQKGQKGEAGVNGSNGSNGAKGQKGQKGEVGQKGQKGQKGQTGGTGSKGQKGEGNEAITSVTAPSGAVDGDLWWDEETGSLYIYYNDGSSSQWVQFNNSVVPDGSITATKLASNSVTQVKLADDAVGSNELKSVVSFVVYNSAGTALKTIYGAGGA